MNYIIFPLTDMCGTFAIEYAPLELHNDELTYTFSDVQLQKLFSLLKAYYIGGGEYFYRSFDAYIELHVCETADEMLTLLSWRYN